MDWKFGIVILIAFLVSLDRANSLDLCDEDEEDQNDYDWRQRNELDYGFGKYDPNWKSIDSRPIPSWYDSSKIGIFIHWGVFSVPSLDTEWFWQDWKIQNQTDIVEFMEKNFKPGFSYQEFAPQFTAEFFNPDQWADLFEQSGAKYVVLTSKHHEGFTLWPSKVSFSWNAMDVGPKRDLVGALEKAIRNRTDLVFGVYHSLYEWFNPLYINDKNNNFTTRHFVTGKTMPELFELIYRYKPEIIWSDGDWEAPPEYWGSQEFLAWLYNESPVKDTVVTNDRWGIGATCHHGGYLTCQDRFNPGKKINRKFENAMTIDKASWGYRRNAMVSDYFSIEGLIEEIVTTVSCGGNILLNVGPTAWGTIPPIMEERLLQMGEWLKVNGEAIYGTQPWKYQNDTLTSDVWYTQAGTVCGPLYATMLNWPEDNQLRLGAKLGLRPGVSRISMLGLGRRQLTWTSVGNETIIQLPTLNPAQLPSKWAWSLKILRH